MLLQQIQSSQWGYEFQRGILLPESSVNRILNGKIEYKEFHIEELKEAVLEFIKDHDKVYASEVAEAFFIKISDAINILETLQKEKRISRLS